MIGNNRTTKIFIIFIPVLLIFGLSKFNGPSSKFDKAFAKKHFWIMKTHSQSQYDLVLMGDSRVYRGLSPLKMEEILTGFDILNFGYSGGGLNQVMFNEVEKRLSENSAQKIIVLGVSPHALSGLAEENKHFNQELNRGLNEVIGYMYFSSLNEFFQPLLIEEVFSLDWGNSKVNKSKKCTEEFFDDGWVASQCFPLEPNQTLEINRENYERGEVVEPELVVQLLLEVSNWCKSGILVFGFRPPTTVLMEELENEMSGFDEDAFKDEFAAAGGIWLDFPSENYISYDGSHITKDSALNLSIDLANSIKDEMNNPYTCILDNND